MKWVVDITGNSGKSLFTDVIERTPGLKVLRVSLDYYRSFKYQTAREISDFKNKHGYPDVIVIDAPRDEETKYLHEVYAALEEINNGRLEGSFGGRQIKDSIPRNIPIVVFSNSPPIIGALSEDRWETMALYEYLGNENRDVYLQKAKVSCMVSDVAGGQVYWKNFTTTVVDSDIGDEYESDKILLSMQEQNIKVTEKLMKAEEELTKQPSKMRIGQIQGWSSMDVSSIGSAPKYVKIKARELLKEISRKKS